MRSFPIKALSVTPAIVCFLAANLTDAISTLVLVRVRGADELNPILNWAYAVSPLTFMLTKIGLAGISLLVIATFAQGRLQQCLMWFGTLLYGAAVLYQCYLYLS